MAGYKQVTVYEVVRKLIGETYPTGNHDEDMRRIENIDEQIGLAEDLIYHLMQISYFKDRPEDSMNQIGKKAHEALGDFKSMIDDRLED